VQVSAAEADAEVGQGGGVHRVEIPTDVNHKVLTKMRDGTPLLEKSVHTMEQHVFAKGVSIIKFQPFLAYFCYIFFINSILSCYHLSSCHAARATLLMLPLTRELFYLHG
jgi:hypothetical protein